MNKKQPMSVNEGDLENVKHMLGVGSHIPKKNWGFRNHFLPGGSDIQSMNRLELAGYVRRGREYDDTFFFHATESGCAAIGLSDAKVREIFSDR